MAKTVPFETVLQYANATLRASGDTPGDRAGRAAVASLLESLLLARNAYKGFRYLTKEELVNDRNTPGIRPYLGDGGDGFSDTDNTRRVYS